MIVGFDELPENARVWVYQANREFTPIEIEGIEEKLGQFVNGWVRHGDDLKASFEIRYNQFIILGVDESFNGVSGCSIDSSVRSIKEIEERYDVDLMNKLNVAFRSGENINTIPLSEFQQFIKEGKIGAETIVYNNMIQSKLELDKNWEVAATNSWHKRFFKP